MSAKQLRNEKSEKRRIHRRVLVTNEIKKKLNESKKAYRERKSKIRGIYKEEISTMRG